MYHSYTKRNKAHHSTSSVTVFIGFRKCSTQSGLLIVNQSGHYTERVPAGFDRTYYATLSVDGNTNPDRYRGYCARPYTLAPGYPDQGSPAWWYVDLRERYEITKIVIYNGNSDWSKVSADFTCYVIGFIHSTFHYTVHVYVW